MTPWTSSPWQRASKTLAQRGREAATHGHIADRREKTKDECRRSGSSGVLALSRRGIEAVIPDLCYSLYADGQRWIVSAMSQIVASDAAGNANLRAASVCIAVGEYGWHAIAAATVGRPSWRQPRRIRPVLSCNPPPDRENLDRSPDGPSMPRIGRAINLPY